MAFKDDLERMMRDEARRLSLGATGQYTEQPLGSDDEGESRVSFTVTAGQVVMNFGKRVSWLALPPQAAREVARLLLAKADEAEKGE